MCDHTPTCPSASAPDADAARLLYASGQGWTVLCNGVFVFEDTGELLPDGRVRGPRRPVPDLAETERRHYVSELAEEVLTRSTRDVARVTGHRPAETLGGLRVEMTAARKILTSRRLPSGGVARVLGLLAEVEQATDTGERWRLLCSLRTALSIARRELDAVLLAA